MTLLTDKQREEVVEAMARAICQSEGIEPDADVDEGPAFGKKPSPAPAWLDYRAHASLALTAALPAIERAVRGDLRLRLARANESLGGIHCAAMNGDNLAVSLCSYFDEGDEWPEGDEADECGWSPSAVDGYTQTIDAIRQHYIRALAGEVG